MYDIAKFKAHKICFRGMDPIGSGGLYPTKNWQCLDALDTQKFNLNMLSN